MLIDFYFFFELFGFLCCVFAYKRLGNNFKIFLPFLTFIIVYEFINTFCMRLLLWHHTNTWCANLEMMMELGVYGYFMASLDRRKAYRAKVYIAVAAGIMITLADILFIHSFWMLATVGIITLNVIQAVLVFSYYYNLLHNLDNHPDLITYPPFLASTGLLLYSISNCFYYATFDYLVYKKDFHFPVIVQVIHELSCVFLYTLLGVAFLCFLRPKKLA